MLVNLVLFLFIFYVQWNFLYIFNVTLLFFKPYFVRV